ncbi:MAG: glutaminase A [Salinarimonadaceae bacterium]|nr:MAG: glutaminase A [Salinarimonadaceae bacterium]
MQDGRGETDHALLERAIAEIVDDAASATERGEPDARSGEIDASRFGIAVATADGHFCAGGDAERSFPIQSISKVFSLTLALEAIDEALWDRVGREPSGDPFNSIIDLERHAGIPRNPFINAGALVVADVLLSAPRPDDGDPPEPVRRRLAQRVGSMPDLDKAVLASLDEGYANRALANLAKSFGNLEHSVQAVMELYVRQCAVLLDCRRLALAGLPLAQAQAKGAPSDQQARRRAKRINALMLTCGQYDGSGEFAYRVGMPAKSGVSGAILAVSPKRASIAVWSPGLDENGNSVLGVRALERLAETMDWSVFGSLR